MAAVPDFVSSFDEPQAIHKLCLEWASWARCAEPGAVTQSDGYLRERTSPGHPGEPTPDIALTDKAVAKMRILRRDYYKYFSRYYLNPTAISEYEIHRQTGTPIERVNAILRQARTLVGYQRHRLQSAG